MAFAATVAVEMMPVLLFLLLLLLLLLFAVVVAAAAAAAAAAILTSKQRLSKLSGCAKHKSRLPFCLCSSQNSREQAATQ